MLPVMLSLVVARALGAAIESQQTLTEAPTTCKPGYVMVNSECKEYCSAMGVITGRCDPNCVRFQDDVCTACVGKFHIKEGVCVRLLWISDEETLVGDSDTEHVCALVPGQGGWQLVPGTNWIWDLNIGRTGTFLFTDQFVFDPWLQTRMTRVSLDVSVDDYYRIVFNGKTLVEKAGGSGQAPISYDVTNFVRKEATSFNPNLLEIHATNTGGVAGLSYKLVVHQNCPEGSDDVEGACVCKNGWIQRGETCVQTAWISGTNTKVGDGVGYAAVLVPQQAGWQAVTGAPWVWDTTIGKVGTFRFVDTIVLSEWLKTKFIGASITVGVDDYFRIVFNGQTITNQAGTPVGAPITYDLTQYFRVGATATNPNVLQIFATNTGGFGGLAYKVVIHQKCQENAEDIDGVCMCKWGYAQVNDGCTQVIWTSGTNTKVGEYNKVPSVLVNPYGPWQSIPKAPWIWHADINKIGTFTFTDSIYLGPWLRYNTASVDITLSVDDFYQIVLNGQLIVEKAGAPNAAPLTFDLTPYFRTNATATDPNILKITATNNAVYGGLAYKLTVHMKCASGADEIDGKCECNPGFAKVGDRCVQTAWRSDCPETMVSTSFRPSIVVPLIPGYQSVAGAAWIWDQISTKPGTVLFKNSVVLVDWIRPRMERATLEVSCDDNYRITLNGQVVTEKTGVWNNPPVTYDITSFLKFNAGTNIPRKATWPANVGGMDFQ